MKTTVFFFGAACVAWLHAVSYEGPVPPVRESGKLLVMGEKPDVLAQGEQARLTVTGERVSQADGVECSKIKTDDGQVVAVSYLAPSIAIGDRVTVTGVMAHMPTCLGPVLKVEDVVILDGG